MAKVTINGEVFNFDRDHKPLAEMMALEKTLGITYGQWERDFQNGSARALAGYIWLVWRRGGRDVAFADIENGTVEIDYNQFDVEDDAPPDPTTAAGPREALTTTGGNTLGSSPKSSTSGRGK